MRDIKNKYLPPFKPHMIEPREEAFRGYERMWDIHQAILTTLRYDRED